MRRVGSFLFGFLRLLCLSLLGVFLVIARYVVRTPQPLKSMLIGEAHVFQWTYGRIFYTVSGPADAPPLLMLHTPEVGGSSYELREMVEPLAHYYRVYALDLLGFGLSDRPNLYYSGETYTALVQDFLTEVIKKPALLLASGLSCNYSIAIAGTRPELCERLILLSPNTLLRERGAVRRQQRMRRLLHNPLIGLFVYALLTIRAVLRYVVAWQQGVTAATVTRNELDHHYAAAHQLGAQYAANAFLTGRLALDVSHQVETVRTPMVLLWGASAANADWSIAELYAANDEAQGVLIQHSNVWPHREQPLQVVEQIMAWYTPVVPLAITANDATTIPVFVPQIILREEQSSEALTAVTQTVGVAAVEKQASADVDAREDTGEREGGVEGVGEQVEAYCVKCKQKRYMLNPTSTVTKNGRNAKVGTCPICGTKLFRFIAS